MRGLVPGRVIRGWRAAVWIPKFTQSVLISRCQCCGREGLPCGGQLPLVDELACPSGLVVDLLERLQWPELVGAKLTIGQTGTPGSGHTTLVWAAFWRLAVCVRASSAARAKVSMPELFVVPFRRH